MIKRLFDIIVALLIVLLSLPVMAVLALLIKLESRGPALFKQARVGLNGNTFYIYKFRSMVADAESLGPYFTSTDDPRITRIGRFIRKTSLDELPQVFNVLNGDMSVVGPRPDVPKQKAGYSDSEWNKRHSVRPGITGLAQALLRSAATPEERVRLDLEYVDKVSFSYDMWIIFLTVKQVLLKGSH